MNITDLSKAILTDQYLNQIKNAAFTAVSNYDDIITNMYIPVGGGIEILYTKNNEVKFKLPEETTTRGGVTIKTSELRALLNEILSNIKA